jgi:hypothetical protein
MTSSGNAGYFDFEGEPPGNEIYDTIVSEETYETAS